jgi:hypothetical protein
VIGTLAAIGISTLLGVLPQRTATALLWGSLILTPLWLWRASPDPEDIGADRNRKELIHQCLDYMRATIPPGALIFTDRQTMLVLAYYDGETQAPPFMLGKNYWETVLEGRWKVALANENYSTAEAYHAGLAAFRQHYGLEKGDPVWVLDGGWEVPSGPPDETRPFTRVVRVFQAAGD